MRHGPRKPPPRSPGGAFFGEGDELRCACGSLMARLLAGDIELKCRRCKRVILISPYLGSTDLRTDGATSATRGCTCSSVEERRAQ